MHRERDRVFSVSPQAGKDTRPFAGIVVICEEKQYGILTGGFFMGTYVNSLNESMNRAVRSEIYVDKTELLKALNKNIESEKCCFAISQARRFGKSMAEAIDLVYCFPDQKKCRIESA